MELAYRAMLSFTYIFFVACAKPSSPEPTPPITPIIKDSTKLNIIWNVPIKNDTNYRYSHRYIYTMNNFVVVESPFNVVLGFKTFNKLDGGFYWEWAPKTNKTTYQTTATNLDVYQKEGKVIANYTGFGQFVIYPTEKKEIWSCYDNREVEYTDYRSAVINDNFYKYTFEVSNSVADSIKYLQRINTNNLEGKWDTIYTLQKTKDNRYRPSIESLNYWVNSVGDTILLFQNRQYNFEIGDAKVDFIAYNLRKKQDEFRLLDIEKSGNSSIHPIVVHKNKAYIAGQFYMHCIDLVTQKIIWEKPFYQLYTCGSQIVKDKLYVKPDNGDLYCLNPETGDVIWENRNTGHNANAGLHFANDIIYFTSSGDGKFYAVDALNGTQYWAEPAPFKKTTASTSFSSAGIAIDTAAGCLYTSDKYHLMAIKLIK